MEVQCRVQAQTEPATCPLNPCAKPTRISRHIFKLEVLYKLLYIGEMTTLKPVKFRGSSLDDLRAFPTDAKREAGHQIDLVQRGLEPDDWKPMPVVGPAVKEIRIRDTTGAFRVVYVAKFGDAIYVLHCFQKKTQRTRKQDIDLAEQRYRELKMELAK
jgi:phage-related protein